MTSPVLVATESCGSPVPVVPLVPEVVPVVVPVVVVPAVLVTAPVLVPACVLPPDVGWPTVDASLDELDEDVPVDDPGPPGEHALISSAATTRLNMPLRTCPKAHFPSTGISVTTRSGSPARCTCISIAVSTPISCVRYATSETRFTRSPATARM